MKVIYLPKQDNIPLRRDIELEFLREETLTFLTTITTAMENPFVYQIASHNLVDVVNAVFIDNLLKIIKDRDTVSLVAGMQNHTLGLMLDVGHRHYVELVGEELAVLQPSVEVEQVILKALSSYINYLYLNNKDTIDQAILTLFETLYNNFTEMDIRQHRVVFVNKTQPAVILIGDTYASHDANAQYG